MVIFHSFLYVYQRVPPFMETLHIHMFFGGVRIWVPTLLATTASQHPGKIDRFFMIFPLLTL